jgi:lysyl-tRNA synthetase, class II
MEEKDNLLEIRLEKLTKIAGMGSDPFPARSQKKQSIKEALNSLEKKVAVAGRIMARRGHGGIQFYDLRDESAKIQIVFKEKTFQKKNLAF